MSPIEEAVSVYQSEPCARPFVKDLEIHLLHGYVFSTPTFFVMGRPVAKWWPQRMIVDPSENPLGRKNCWHVYLCAGDLLGALSAMPFTLPFTSFERNNTLKVYRTDALLRRISKLAARSHRGTRRLLQGWRPKAATALAASCCHHCG